MQAAAGAKLSEVGEGPQRLALPSRDSAVSFVCNVSQPSLLAFALMEDLCRDLPRGPVSPRRCVAWAP
eukprot:2763687-Pyramimonas_sp.AAC.1